MIKVKKHNLYYNGTIDLYDNEHILSREKKKAYLLGNNYINYLVREGDRLDTIASKHYVNKIKTPSNYWWYIADINNIENPLDISDYIGKNIKIPDINYIDLI